MQAVSKAVAAVTLTLLGACVPQQPHVAAPNLALGLAAQIRLTPPPPEDPQCWHRQMRPALFETVTEQIVASAEERDATTGAVTKPATLQSVTHQKELRPRQTIWFRVPCESDIGQADIFTASLQRALKARGLFMDEVSGEMTEATAQAARRYQLGYGLDSPVLSYAAAQSLGLVANY